MSNRSADVIVIGSGAAGLATALALAPLRVLLLTKTDSLAGGSTLHAQGGIAAAVGEGDEPALHAADTLAAGAGHCDRAAVELLTSLGPGAIAWLAVQGMDFDRDPAGGLALGREAAHGRRRVLHAGGDATGAALVRALAAAAERSPLIALRPATFAWDLLRDRDGAVCGVLAHTADSGWGVLAAPHVVLATGGAGQVYPATSNPVESTGDGIAIAARAGAALADMELVQFHPTALAVEAAGQLPLLTEALRGEGARLVDARGHPILAGEHPDGELAPRDVVARAMWRHRARGVVAYLDARHIDRVAARFPTAAALCARHGLDPRTDLLPVTPAAHYLMGGVRADTTGRTDLPGLWAVGEVSCTGVHGGNRLASNSLLECVVFARRAAEALARSPMHRGSPLPAPPPVVRDAARVPLAALREIMYRDVGLMRDHAGLSRALAELEAMQAAAERAPALETASHDRVRAWGEARNLLAVAIAIARAALARRESLGAHWRTDAPPAAAPTSEPRTTAGSGTDR